MRADRLGRLARLAGRDPCDLPAGGRPSRAQLRFTDHDGCHFHVFLTDQPDLDIAVLDLRHRQRPRVEDRVRAAKAAGLADLPSDLWRRNTVWLELVLAAQDLTYWAEALLLDGALAVAEPTTLSTCTRPVRRS